MTPKQVLAMIKEKGVVMVDVKFIDLLGTWQHFTAPISEFKDEAPFDEGLGFDGSSIRGWQAIDNSDMLVIPDPDTAVMDPFTKDPTLSIIANISDPITRADYTRDPRNISRKAEAYLKTTGIGDSAFFGPEPEFFIFDSLRYDTTQNSSYYYIDSNEGNWNSGKEGGVKEGANLGFKVKNKAGYFPVPPVDTLQDIRTEMVLEMERVGIRVEKQHHEVATAGQAEIDMRFQTLTKMADWLTWYKYIVKNVAVRHGMTATFMPKPIFGDNGTGMHTHQSIWKGETPLFAGNGYAGMSETCDALHRGHPASRADDRGLHQSGDELVSPAGAGLRGADQPGVLLAQPLGLGANPDVFAVAQGQANRSALPGPDLQSVSRVLGDAHGGYRRYSAPARSGPAARQGHLRTDAGRAGRGAEHARVARGVARQPEEGSRVPAEGRRLHRGSDRDLDRIQDG